ncbi:MAG: hypothetical protein K5877_02820 [Lachnospiraceae bacterium]|nr:hypothetical protein [Lachnospiraceae bacterium]
MRKIAVVFPGVGYTKDRPLLYYAGKIAGSHGYELVHMDFSGIKWSKEQLKDKDFLLKTLDHCLERANTALANTDLSDNVSVLFISKSIGTIVATAYAKLYGINAKQICFTPLEFIDRFAEEKNGLIFYGSSDPYADPDVIAKICCEKHLTVYRIADADHSLETGDVIKDISNLEFVMSKVKEFINIL